MVSVGLFVDHGVLGSNPSGAPFHILHFMSDIYFLVSKILSPMWNLEMGDVTDPPPDYSVYDEEIEHFCRAWS